MLHVMLHVTASNSPSSGPHPGRRTSPLPRSSAPTLLRGRRRRVDSCGYRGLRHGFDQIPDDKAAERQWKVKERQ